MGTVSAQEENYPMNNYVNWMSFMSIDDFFKNLYFK